MSNQYMKYRLVNGAGGHPFDAKEVVMYAQEVNGQYPQDDAVAKATNMRFVSENGKPYYVYKAEIVTLTDDQVQTLLNNSLHLIKDVI